MKKNAMLKIAAILLVAVLLTTCAISSTFAKYVTAQATATSKSARVAKWGVTLTTTFAATNAEFDLSAQEDDVVFSASDATIAPGSSNTMTATTVISGTPEVSFEITNEATLTLTNWKVDSTDYVPLTFYINGSEIDLEGATTMADIKTKVEAAINAESKEYRVDAGAVDTEDYVLAISWAWDFEATDNADDTALGDAAAAGTNAPTISLSVKQTATQLN